METIFYVIRHGETDWNATGRWQGMLDVPLNETGRQQARQLARRLLAEGTRFDAIYSSDLSRALETAQIVARALGRGVQELYALREIDIGAWSGLHTDEIRRRFADDLARIDAGDDIKRGGGESFNDLMLRIAEAVEQLAEAHAGQTLAIFTHGGCVRALHSYAQRSNGEPPQRYHGHIGNTSISMLYRDPAGWRSGLINDMAHLEGVVDHPPLTPDDAERPSEHQV